MKHNNVLPNGHFHKDWARRVKTWFNQPARKQRRRIARSRRAAYLAPRPIDGLLRPAVRCPTTKYNVKLRAGRGFTLEELKAAEIPRRLAPTIGIAVDHRRKNRSEEGLKLNVRRLRAYQARLVVFPRRHGRVKKGDTNPADVPKGAEFAKGGAFPVKQVAVKEKARKVTEEERKGCSQYEKLRMAWKEEKLRGYNAKRAKERAEEEANKVNK